MNQVSPSWSNPCFSTFSPVHDPACAALVQYVLNSYEAGSYSSSMLREAIDAHPAEDFIHDALIAFQGHNDTNWLEVLPDFMCSILVEYQAAWAEDEASDENVSQWSKKIARFTGDVIADCIFCHAKQ